jgi:serine/threonine protein kinase
MALDPEPHAKAEPPGIPDFELLRRIGTGGFGDVWLSRSTATGTLRAIKVIPKAAAGASRELVSLTRLEACARRRSPDLLPIHHVGQTERHLFIVMDLADDVSADDPGSEETYRPASLDHRLEAGPLDPDRCLECARQLLRGLAALHEGGMVHRDVKPANCLFVSGELKLADFGLLTDAGPDVSRIGTERYMPPDGRMDTRADVYAAGLVLYELVTGLPADRFPSLGSRARQIVENPILRSLLRISLTAASARRDERYPHAAAMAEALETALRDQDSHASGRWRSAALAVVAGIVLVASAIFLLSKAPSQAEVSFITLPHFGASIYIDGKQAFREDGTPYETPCTVEGVPARECRVEFRLEGQPTLDAGSFDFSETRQITVTWP